MRKPERALAWVAPLAGVAVLLASCRPPVAKDRYVVEVLGSREALDRYAVQADGLQEEGRFFTRNQYLQRFSVEAGAGLLERPALSVRSRSEGSEVDAVTLQPFVCGSRPEQYTRLREDGWRFVERHQLMLTEDGRLRRDTDLERLLSYACEASSPSAVDSGEAWSTPLGTLGACSEPERAATRVVLESAGESRPAHLCHATYLQRYGGAVHLGFSFMEPGSELPLTVSLWHCMDPLTAAYPLTLEVGADFPRGDCPRVPGASGLVGGEPRSAALLRGTWRISRLDFTDGGHLVGEVDAVFAVPGGDGEMRLHGPVDVPLLRIPFSGGIGP